jgi:antitoxin FitA
MGMIQIRNVPDDLHRRLKARAAEAGMSLSDYLLRMADRDTQQLTMAELYARVKRRTPVKLPAGLIVDLIREDREER